MTQKRAYKIVKRALAAMRNTSSDDFENRDEEGQSLMTNDKSNSDNEDIVSLIAKNESNSNSEDTLALMANLDSNVKDEQSEVHFIKYKKYSYLL